MGIVNLEKQPLEIEIDLRQEYRKNKRFEEEIKNRYVFQDNRIDKLYCKLIKNEYIDYDDFNKIYNNLPLNDTKGKQLCKLLKKYINKIKSKSSDVEKKRDEIIEFIISNYE